MSIVRIAGAALAALFAASASIAQTSTFGIESLTPAAGGWSYRSFPGGSEATFADAGGAQLALRCNRVSQTVSIMRSGVPAATATLSVWTTSLSRSVPARFGATGVLTADVAGTDPLLDAIALSRGKFATSALGAPMTAYPAWGELSRVIEDCRR